MPRDVRSDPLFRPLAIGPVTAPNRFWQVPHCTGMGWQHPAALVAMRGVKAEGGWGVVNSEYCSIHPSSDDTPAPYASLRDDGDVATWAPWPMPCTPTARWRGSNCGTAGSAAATCCRGWHRWGPNRCRSRWRPGSRSGWTGPTSPRCAAGTGRGAAGLRAHGAGKRHRLRRLHPRHLARTAGCAVDGAAG